MPNILLIALKQAFPNNSLKLRCKLTSTNSLANLLTYVFVSIALPTSLWSWCNQSPKAVSLIRLLSIEPRHHFTTPATVGGPL